MKSKKNLEKAFAAKNDEFYTQLSDIEKELKHYHKHFKVQNNKNKYGRY